MGKRNNKAKRSLTTLPRGLVRKNGGGGNGQRNGGNDPGNPFEMTARNKRPKHEVHNRPISKPKSTKYALESLQRRQSQLRSNLRDSKKSNSFVDRRIGQHDPEMSTEDQMLARLVKERTRQSNRSSKYRLDDIDDDNLGSNDALLTHKGQKLDPSKSEVMYSDDEDDHKGNLEAVDTELHFGGAGLSSMGTPNIYGNNLQTGTDLSKLYGQTRKNELDDLIARRKAMKAVKMEAKEDQLDTFEKMDENYGDLSELLRFRKNEKRPKVRPEPTQEDKEMKEWNSQLREMMSVPKRRATDRTKTPEEIAKEKSEQLHELETRRLARMNGDFEEDDFSDISVSGDTKKKNKKPKRQHRNPDELSDSDDDDDDDDNKDGLEVKFTADGLKSFDKDGNIVESDQSDSDDDSNSDAEEGDTCHPLPEGSRVRGNYRAKDQYDGRENWYDAIVTKVHKNGDDSVTYTVEYDDGDIEENVIPKNVRPSEKEVVVQKPTEDNKDIELQLKRKKAKEKARNEMPYVFEAVTTLEGLHDLIAKYASTGKDASIIIKRIYASNSVRLDHRNGERMQNFYDVLLRRFIAVGDAIFSSGDGGKELGRYEQMNNIAKVMYDMAQDSPESAGAVWSRRIGVLRNAHEKRLRDSDFVHNDDGGMEEWSAWPSTGVFLLIRALGHIFPVTDRRHHVVTPAIIFLAQITAQTPVLSTYDLTMGIMCSGLLMEYTKEAKRVVPEALSFVASAIRLFSPNMGNFSNPALQAAYNQPFCRSLRDKISKYEDDGNTSLPSLKLEKDFITNNETSEIAVALLSLCISLVEKCTLSLKGSFSVSAETELLYEVTSAILSLQPKSYPPQLQKKISRLAVLIAEVCPTKRVPLQRRGRASIADMSIKTLAPRMEDPERYSMSKDKGKKSMQTALDRTRREYKREHKAITRELRIDGAFIETERRKDQDKKDGKARAKRNKNFAWLEGEVGAMNEQVRQGGGLLKGGGTGLARAKAATGQMGIKKGGKFR